MRLTLCLLAACFLYTYGGDDCKNPLKKNSNEDYDFDREMEELSRMDGSSVELISENRSFGKDSIFINDEIIPLEVWEKKERAFGQLRTVYTIMNGYGSYMKDSTIYENGSYVILENNNIQGYSRSRNLLGEETFLFFDGKMNLKEAYTIHFIKDSVYSSKGNLLPRYKRVHGDTAFLDVDYGGGDWGLSQPQMK